MRCGDAGGFEVHAAGAADDAVGSGEKDGVAGNFGAAAGDVGVLVLQVDLNHSGWLDLQLGEVGGVWVAGELCLDVAVFDEPGDDAGEGNIAPLPVHRLGCVGEGGAHEELCAVGGPAALIGGGQQVRDVPGTLQLRGQRLGEAGGDT